uniref:HAD family hydrolase n=1 Tax=Gemmiger formicilis TaxID=745368 RepID=UPI0040258B23
IQRMFNKRFIMYRSLRYQDMICRACGMRREDAVYVGDGASDIATAEAAEIPCIYVTWGQGNQKDEENPYNYRVVNTADELLQTLQNQGK